MTLIDRSTRFFLILATTAGATFTVLVAGGSGSLESTTIRAIYIGMAALALIPWLFGAIFRPSWRVSSRLVPGMVAIAAAYMISTITSRNPRLSVEMLAYVVLLLLVYLLLVRLMRQPVIRTHFARLALLLAFLVGALYILQVSLAWIEWWGVVGHLTVPPLRPGYAGLTLGSPNPVATLTLLLTAFVIATTDLQGPPGRVVAVLLVVVTAAATFLSGSRGAWLGALIAATIAVAVAVALIPVVGAQVRRLARSPRGRSVIAFGGAALTISVAFAAISGRVSLDDGGYRAAFARASLQMFESAPLSGVGPGVWRVLRAQSTPSTDVDLYIPHAHNVYLQTLAEFGIVGVVAGGILLGSLGAMLWRALRSGEPTRQSVAIAALFALALLAVQQLVDVLVNVPALLLAVVLPIAWVDASDDQIVRLDSPGSTRSRNSSRFRYLAAALAAVLIVAGLARIEAVAGIGDRAVAAANAGHWAEAAARFGEAVAADPDVVAYRFQFGVSAANAGDLRLAEHALAESASADDFAYAWLNLAAVQRQLGDLEGARDSVGRAERLGRQRLPVALAAGWLRQQLGDDAAAIQGYAAAVMLDPTLALDPFWSSSAGPRGGLEAVVRAAEVLASDETRLHLYLVLGRFEEARAQGNVLAGADGGFSMQVVSAWEGDAASWADLQRLAGQRPLDGHRAAWCRLVAVHLEDEQAIDRYAEWLGALGSPVTDRPRQARIRFGSPEVQPPLFLDRYGSVYRRDVLAAPVVGILPQVTWARDG